MAIALSTAGIKVLYAVETTAGTKPTAMSAYTEIPDVKSIPSFGDDINALQSTPLSATTNHTYIPGLKDSGGAIALTVNDSAAFQTAWSTAKSASDTGWALSTPKATWICYLIPGLTNAFYYQAKFVGLGFGGADVDEVLENIANLIPQSDYSWAAKPTTT